MNSSSHWDIWYHDYWGESLSSKTSHKSWRPITTYTFRWNYARSGLDLFEYHIVNVFLHALTSALLIPTTATIFPNSPIPVVVSALIFAVHPIHVEAVSNITGRAEILGALFYVLGYLFYTKSVLSDGGTVWARILMTLFMTVLSMLSKEPGITLPILCAIWDLFCGTKLSLWTFFTFWNGEKKNPEISFRVRQLCFRLAALCAGIAIIAFLRFEWSGATEPIFVYDQNPAAMHRDRMTRIFSIGWVWCLYLQTLLVPHDLCCDWSGDSIPLIHSTSDWRFPILVSVFVAFVGVVYHTKFWSHTQNVAQRQLLMCLAFVLIPFVLSSNLFIVVGFMKADRVMYLPSVGYCMLWGWFTEHLVETDGDTDVNEHSTIAIQTQQQAQEQQPQIPQEQQQQLPQVQPQEQQQQQPQEQPQEPPQEQPQPTPQRLHTKSRYPYRIPREGWFMFLGVMLGGLTLKCFHRNYEWRDGYSLWHSAYIVNPNSAHIWHNYGLDASWKERYEEAADLFGRAATRNPRDLNTWFAWGVALRKLGKCDEARVILKQAWGLADYLEKFGDGETPIREHRQEKAFIITALALCETSVPVVGEMLHLALSIDPANTYALRQAQELLQLVESSGKVGHH
eukprot:c5617_g1_i1.p1 GENE.c5617_g1_i1~~c5617_g1_i1.p1  ORF type:complete len:676 (+),score=128.13 c5617_g1_i1:160-2028(+)